MIWANPGFGLAGEGNGGGVVPRGCKTTAQRGGILRVAYDTHVTAKGYDCGVMRHTRSGVGPLG